MHEKFMAEAIALSRVNMEQGAGGPFGCVIVKDGQIIGRGSNSVLRDNDPTAHAEINAIRAACHHLGTFQLTDCSIYTSCEPCPMCLGAIYWARPDVVYFANTRADAAAIGFDDALIYDELQLPLSDRRIPMVAMENQAAMEIFAQWKANNLSY